MQSIGILELIVLLTSLGGFGVDANPKAPSGADVMQFAPADADLMVHVDLQAFVPRNYKALMSLRNQPGLRNNAEAQQMLSEGLREVDMVVKMAKNMIGIDPINDIHSLTVWAKLPSAGDPEAMAVVRGKFSPSLLDAAAGMGAQIVQVDGAKAAIAPGGVIMASVHKGDLFVGSRSWVEKRVKRNWSAVRIAAGSPAANMKKALDAKPFFMIASKPSRQALRRIMQELPSDNVAADLVGGHEYAGISLSHKGVAWTVKARGKEGYERALMASEGVIGMFRASQISIKAIAKLAMATIRSYRGKVPQIDAILANEKQLMNLLSQYSGDGNFKVNMKKNAKKRLLSVTATGKKLSDVLPVTGLMPLIAAGAAFALFSEGTKSDGMIRQPERKKSARAMDAETSAGEGQMMPAGEPSAAALGVDVQNVYRAVKQARGM